MEDCRFVEGRDIESLDTAPEAEFNELARLAAKICDTPMSMITLLEEHRVRLKARYGVPSAQSACETAFCNHTIRGDELFVVEDARKHPLFQDNPFVTQRRGVRFYAGMPISGREGLKLGTLCVADYVPRQLSDDHRSTLQTLARQASAHLELRLQQRDLRTALEERTTLLAELSAREQLFRTFMHYSPLASFIKDANGRYVFYNRRMAESAGVTLDSAIGLTDIELWPSETACRLRANDQLALDTGTVLEIDEVTTTNGKTTEWRCFKFPWRTATGEQMLAGIALDVTAERLQHAQVRHYQAKLEENNIKLTWSANTDPLTGLANRRALDEGIQAAEDTPVIPGDEIAVLTVDIDYFKQVNDTFGHAYGDLALRQIASALIRCTRAQDLVARSGGEEFTILLPVGGVVAAVAIAQRILGEVHSIPWPYQPISVSVGIAIASIEDPTLREVVARSDQALYLAKQQGRDRFIYVEAESVNYSGVPCAAHRLAMAP